MKKFKFDDVPIIFNNGINLMYALKADVKQSMGSFYFPWLHNIDRFSSFVNKMFQFYLQIEREKADLSVQVIQMSERLEEAEGGAESQFAINRNRDVELQKLRKLLDDVHLESEETAHLLKKKHQEILNDFQEQVDILSKGKTRWVLSANINEILSIVVGSLSDACEFSLIRFQLDHQVSIVLLPMNISYIFHMDSEKYPNTVNIIMTA